MINIPFDQYQRYKTASDIIENYRENRRKFTILEVGANAHKNLEKFLPNDNIIYIDIDFPDETQDSHMIKGDATDMKFEDNSFDIIVALDVYEHIPVDRRNLFLKEINRVAKNGFIIGAPFDHDKTREAEYRVNSVYRSLYGSDFIWLKEHIENSLPSEAKTKDFLNLNEIPYIMAYHGNIDIWEKLMSVYFLSLKNESSQNYKQQLDTFYNKNIYPVDFDYTGEDVYRSFIIGGEISKNSIIRDLIKKKDADKLESQYKRLLNLCNIFSDVLNQHNNISEELNEYIEIFEDDTNCKVSILPDDIISNKCYERFIPLQSKKIERGLRIDPCNKKCLLLIENIFMKHNQEIYVAEYNTNATVQSGNIYYFDHDDPQIQITNCIGKDVTGLIVRFRYIQYGDINMAYTNCTIKMNNRNIQLEKDNINNLNEIYEKKQMINLLEQEKERLQEEKEILQIRVKTNEETINKLNEHIEIVDFELNSIKEMKIWKFIEWIKNRRK